MKKAKKDKIPDDMIEEAGAPAKYDLKAAHRKAVMVMIGIFVAMLLLMLYLSEHVDFASTGGM